MKPRVSGGNDLPALSAVAALPIGHDAPRRLNNRHHRLNVIGVKTGLHHEINMPARQHRIGIAIGAEAGQLCLL